MPPNMPKQSRQPLRGGRPQQLIRPAAPPQRIMPKTPPPPPASVRQVMAQRGVRPSGFGQPVGRGAPAVGPAAPVGFAPLNTFSANETIASEVSSLQSSLSDLQTRSTFSGILSEIADLDASLNRVSVLLESARNKGYVFQNDLEQTLYNAMSRWEAVQPQIVSTVNQQSSALQSQLMTVNPMIQRLNTTMSNPTAAAPVLRNTQSHVNQLLSNISQIESSLKNQYQDVQSQANQVNNRLSNIHWAMEQLGEAKFSLESGEDLVMAVKARWDKEGKDDPEGILYLSNRRLVFERKEKVATKKVLFITTASELVHEVSINQPLGNVRAVRPENKGLFGHQDFLFVQFSDGKLGEIAFHIDGQDSKEWASLIERARSGQTERERITGSGLSIADLSKPLTQADVLAVQSEVGQLQDEMMLREARQELSTLENQVHSLARKLTGLRSRGYVIEKDLEADALILNNQWDRVKANAGVTLETQTRLLGDQMRSIQDQLSQLAGLSGNLTAARPVYMQLKSAIASAESQSGAAQALVLTQYDQYANEVEALDAHIEWVEWMLDALSTASFRLLATECGVAATEAVFQFPGLEPENGILFLSDQRLLWEDRVGDYELKVNVPLQEVLDVRKESDEQAEFEYLEFRFGASGPLPTARFQLSLPVADEWIKMVGRARSGGYVQDRAVEVSEAELERIRNAPQQCSRCGATFTAPILRGQTEITCEYCGLVVRI